MRFQITFIGLMLCLAPCLALGQDIPEELYKASTIPDSLKENANSVVRYSENIINIKAPGKAVIKRHIITTILNEKAKSGAIMAMGYNRKYDVYSSILMTIYNENGDVIKKYRKGDMYDGSASNDETIVTNERFLAVRHAIASYPVTVEIEYEESIGSFISLGGWSIQDQAEQSVQNSTCVVTANPTMGFRFKNENTNIQPTKGNKDGGDVYSWEVRNLKAIKQEDYVLRWKVLSDVLFAVNSFNCYGYDGDFTNWQSFGKWILSLNNGGTTLIPDRIKEIQGLTANIQSDKEKARFLYNYMQKSMRYVSIQLGIGGYKPFPATFVDEKKYGDCKALSNYMYALLNAVGIKSYYAIIRAGVNEKPADISFPNNAFNHAILCVPFANDTTWLECTSNTQPFGKLGPFTENRNALLITEDGGKLVNTPASVMQDNQVKSNIHIALNADGGAKAALTIAGTGKYRTDYVNAEGLKVDDQKQLFMRWFNIKQPSLFDFNPSTDSVGIKVVNINLEYDKLCDIIAGDKQFYKPHLVSLGYINIPINEGRKNDLYLTTPIQESCITTIDLPEGFAVETLPANQSLNFTYGNYQVNYVYDSANNKVIGTEKFILTSRIIPAAKYTEFQQYLDGVAKAQNKKLVIKRKA